MREINRSLMVVKPKQPFLVWARSRDSEDEQLELKDLQDDATAYLIPEFETFDERAEILEWCADFVMATNNIFRFPASRRVLGLRLGVLFLTLIGTWPCLARNSLGAKRAQPWRAVHLLNYNNDPDLEALGQNLPQLAALGINTVILEVDYNFAFQSHPELRRGTNPITREGARKFAATCRKLGIRVIPEFQSLGHQSWKGETFPLLTAYPLFDSTPGAFPGNEGVYCREWDPLNPAVNKSSSNYSMS
jgi:hypothetical protein